MGHSLGFRDCQAETLDALMRQSNVRELKKGQSLIRQGDDFHALYFLVHGKLEISVNRYDGRRHMVGYVGVGDFVGLVGLIDGKRELNDVCARLDSAVVVIPAEEVWKYFKSDPHLALAIAVQLALRNRFMSERLAGDSSPTIVIRLARVLHSLSTVFGAIKISQSELADWVGSSRQRVNFALQVLQKSGFVRIDRFEVEIVDLKAFEAYLAET